MLPHKTRSIVVAAFLLLLTGATLFAADPWNTGNPWNAPSSGATPGLWNVPSGAATPDVSDSHPFSMVSAVSTVGSVPSVATLPSVSLGVVPTPVPSGLAPKPPEISTMGIGLSGNPSAGAHIVTMKCAGCHGDDGSGHGVELVELGAKQPPVSWTDKAAMAQFSDQQIAAKISGSARQEDSDSSMPAFDNQLSAQDINNVVAYIRTLAQ